MCFFSIDWNKEKSNLFCILFSLLQVFSFFLILLLFLSNFFFLKTMCLLIVNSVEKCLREMLKLKWHTKLHCTMEFNSILRNSLFDSIPPICFEILKFPIKLQHFNMKCNQNSNEIVGIFTFLQNNYRFFVVNFCNFHLTRRIFVWIWSFK